MQAPSDIIEGLTFDDVLLVPRTFVRAAQRSRSYDSADP